MLDVFNEEIEVLIKDGIANLYWFKGDLHKAWMRSGVPDNIRNEIVRLKDEEGRELSKRRQMDGLYERLRSGDYNRRLEISRNFVCILVEQESFTPQSDRHRVEIAERCSLKLRELVRKQTQESQRRETSRPQAARPVVESYDTKRARLQAKFVEAHTLAPQPKGYALEAIVNELLQASGISVEAPFRIEGEQLDGAVKFDGHYYLLEIKWTAEKTEPKEIGHFFYKVEGKMGARGIFLSMNGFTSGSLATLPKGKELKVMLLDGNHLANVLSGAYSFRDLLDHAIRHATLRGEIYCPHTLQKHA